jgi:hypothetical protein
MNDRTSLPMEDIELSVSAPAGLLDLSRQQRNLLLLRPLFQLELNKQRIGDESTADKGLFQGLDTSYMALSALDRMMEGTTISTGCTRDEMLSHLAEIARLMKPNLTRNQQQKVADVILGTLDNKANGYREFAFEHFDAGRGAMRAVKFKLVVFEPDLEDVYRYKPTPDGYLVYLGMLDLAPEDYQELMEKMLDLLVQRGRFDAALEIARRARTLSIEYRQLIRDRLHQAYRAPGTVDWRREVEWEPAVRRGFPAGAVIHKWLRKFRLFGNDAPSRFLTRPPMSRIGRSLREPCLTQAPMTRQLAEPKRKTSVRPRKVGAKSSRSIPPPAISSGNTASSLPHGEA